MDNDLKFFEIASNRISSDYRNEYFNKIDYDIKKIIFKEKENVIDELKQLIDEKRYFEGLILSIAYYETLAMDKLIKFLKSNKFDEHISIEDFERYNNSFARKIELLYLLKIIDKKHYNNINRVNGYRNDLVHHKIKSIAIWDRTYIVLIRHAILCYKELLKK